MAGAHYPSRITGSALVPVPVTAVARVKAAAQLQVGVDTYPITGDSTGASSSTGETPLQREAWTAYDKIPEVKTLTQGTANLLAQCQLFVGRKEFSNGHEVGVPGRSRETGAADAKLGEVLVANAEDALARYVDASGAQGGLIRNLMVCWQVVGECRMVGYYIDDDEQPCLAGPNATERWIVCTPGAITHMKNINGLDEYELSVTRTRKIKLPTAIVHPFAWADGRYPGEPSAWVIGALDVCRDIRSFTMALRAAARSGIPADLFLVPTEASPQAINPQGWGPGDEGAIVTAQTAADEWAAKVEDLIGEYVTTVLEDMNTGNSIIPGVLAVESRFVEFFKKISFARQVDRGIGELVRDARLRLASAADCAPEMLKGLGTTNRWNGAQVADDEYRRYYRPKAEAIADQWTHRLLWADLKERGFAPDEYRKIRVLVDSTGVVAEPDFTTIAPAAMDRFVIGPSGYRRLLHIPESAAPTPAETTLMKEIGAGPASTPGPGQGDTGPPSDPGTPNPSKGTVVHKAVHMQNGSAVVLAAGPDYNAMADKLAAIELRTRAKLVEACESALDRSIEKAGAHLRNWARKAGGDLRALSASTEWPAGCKPAALLELANTNTDNRREELFTAALAALLVHWHRIALAAFASAALVVGQQPRQADVNAAVDRSVELLRLSMLMLADEVLFGRPGIPEPTIGEVSHVRIPAGLIARVLGTAGGSPGITAGLTGAVEAALGLVFGPLIEKLLPASTGLLWVYGDPAERRTPFPEHEALDGGLFNGPTDPALTGSVFASHWFPGDHRGCQCMWVPRY